MHASLRLVKLKTWKSWKEKGKFLNFWTFWTTVVGMHRPIKYGDEFEKCKQKLSRANIYMKHSEEKVRAQPARTKCLCGTPTSSDQSMRRLWKGNRTRRSPVDPGFENRWLEHKGHVFILQKQQSIISNGAGCSLGGIHAAVMDKNENKVNKIL